MIGSLHMLIVVVQAFQEFVQARDQKKTRTEKVCETCGRVLASVASYRLHKMQHTTDKPHHCNICDASFKLKAYLQVSPFY